MLCQQEEVALWGNCKAASVLARDALLLVIMTTCGFVTKLQWSLEHDTWNKIVPAKTTVPAKTVPAIHKQYRNYWHAMLYKRGTEKCLLYAKEYWYCGLTSNEQWVNDNSTSNIIALRTIMVRLYDPGIMILFWQMINSNLHYQWEACNTKLDI